MKEYLRPDEVAKKLQISKRTVYTLMDNPEDPLPSFKIGNSLRIKTDDLERWLERHQKKPWE